MNEGQAWALWLKGEKIWKQNSKNDETLSAAWYRLFGAPFGLQDLLYQFNSEDYFLFIFKDYMVTLNPNEIRRIV